MKLDERDIIYFITIRGKTTSSSKKAKKGRRSMINAVGKNYEGRHSLKVP
jgi:hypothetical protein